MMPSRLHLTLQLLISLLAASFSSADPSGDFVRQRPSQCEISGCFPPFGNLLIGRAAKLTASSTHGGQVIGNIVKQPTVANSHSDVNSTLYYPDQPDKWWQSEPGQRLTSIRLDLDVPMEFVGISIIFKQYLPSAFILETSHNSGRSFQLVDYFSANCDQEYPGIPVASRHVKGQISCVNYNDSHSALELDKKAVNINLPYVKLITNLRLNLTQLPLHSNVYKIDEMYVNGTCNCHGHAKKCLPNFHLRENFSNIDQMVYSSCDCDHRTAGSWCELCDDFYNDAEWQTGTSEKKNECQKCNCNDRASSCYYDVSLSTGVCTGCVNSKGLNCQRCKSFFYGGSNSTCVPCNCSSSGSTDNLCDEESGQCSCLPGKTGLKCDKDV